MRDFGKCSPVLAVLLCTDFRPRSSYVLLSELFLRGIPREVASSVVDSHYDEEKACRHVTTGLLLHGGVSVNLNAFCRDIACRKSRLSNEDLKLALLRKASCVDVNVPPNF